MARRPEASKTHSYLNATIGSTRVARRAGIKLATSATATNTTGTPTNVAESVASLRNPYGDPHSVRLDEQDLSSGLLERTSYARPGKLFTASNDVMIVEIGRLRPPVLEQIIRRLIQLLRPRPA